MSRLDLLPAAPSHRYASSPGMPFEVCLLMQKVPLFLRQMDQVASSSNVDMNKNVFQDMGMPEKRLKVKEDPVTKLRGLENRSEMNRASV